MLKKYMKQRLPILLLFLIFAAIFFAVFALYQVPLEAVLYPLLLCIVMGAGAVVWDYLRACRFHRQMEHICTYCSIRFSSADIARESAVSSVSNCRRIEEIGVLIWCAQTV